MNTSFVLLEQEALSALTNQIRESGSQDNVALRRAIARYRSAVVESTKDAVLQGVRELLGAER